MDPEEIPPDAGDTPPPPTPERKLLLWAAILFATNLVCVLMLAARSESAANMRGYFDAAILAVMLGAAAFGIVRLMFLFPFRLLDLIVMVFTLAFGMKGAIEGANWIRSAHWLAFFQDSHSKWTAPDAPSAILSAECCIVTACVLMGGATLGLRNCRLLKFESPVQRAIVLVFGMLGLPAIVGLATIPVRLLNILLTEKQTTLEALLWVGALVFSGVTVLANASFSVRGMALKTVNATQEKKWREK